MNKLWTDRLFLSTHAIAKLLVVFILLASDLSKAQTCENAHLSAEIQVKDLSGVPFPMSEVRDLTLRLNRLAGKLRVQKLEIQVKKVSSQYSSYDPLENVLLLGVADSQAFNSKLQVVLSHEFGHAIVSQALKLKFLDSPQTISEALQSVGRKDKKKQKLIRDVYELSAPYDELFADLTAALLFQNGKVFPESLSHTEKEAPRDFTKIHSFASWKNAEPSLAPYMNLDPVRGALWSWIQKKQIPESQYPLILEALLNATAQHMQIRLDRRETPAKLVEASKLNQEFFRLLMTELQAKGL